MSRCAGEPAIARSDPAGQGPVRRNLYSSTPPRLPESILSKTTSTRARS